jgi:hypothetical protein
MMRERHIKKIIHFVFFSSAGSASISSIRFMSFYSHVGVAEAEPLCLF